VTRNDEQTHARRQVLRRATLYSIGFLAAVVVIAVGGAAFVAWLLSRAGLPFMKTWLIVTAIIVLPGLLATIWNRIRGR
jgi:ABC-type Fe3+ transport system permease subunit